MNDYLAVAVAFVYVFAAIGIAEGLRLWRGYPADFTRKFIHVAVGMWAVGTVCLFDDRRFAVVPPLVFVALNYVSYRREAVKAMDTGDNMGTVYFPISFAVLIYLFWEKPNLAVASLMPMTWGDAMAAVFGRHYGQHKYTVFGKTRSLEGSLTMLVFSFLSSFLALWLMPPMGVLPALGHALALSVVATAAEALSPRDFDNLVVPAACGLLLALLAGA